MAFLIKDASLYVDKEVEIKGWLYNRRSSGKIHFLQLRDGSGIIQGIVVKNEVSEDIFELCDHLGQESSLIVKGIIQKHPKKDEYEILIKHVQVIQNVEDYPITPKEHGVDFLMKRRHLWLRSKKQWALLRIRSTIINSAREYFNKRDFIMVDAPIFTPNAAEGTTTLFEVDYFGDPAYLSQSGQLYVEAAAMSLGKVYCFGPVFRAEKSKTRRHLTEFWQIEPEMAFVELDEDMDYAEGLVEYIITQVLEKNEKELDILERDKTKLENYKKPFYRISYTEAVEIANKKGVKMEWGEDFGAPHEATISEEFDKPVFVHRYPANIKAFYMKKDPENPKLSLCFDMLAPEGYGEVIGGSQREDSYDALVNRIKEHNLPLEAFEWYLDLRKYGTVPHSGFGLGIERTVAWISGIRHVRETIPFPRMLDKIYP